jgi:hypothetical protein
LVGLLWAIHWKVGELLDRDGPDADLAGVDAPRAI